MKRDILNSPRLLELKKHRRRVFRNKVLLSLVALIVIFASLSYISGLKQLNISEVEILGNKIVDTEAIKKVVEEQIAGKYFWLFPKTNILFYPKNKIETELKNKFKRIKDITINNENTKTLKVSLTERVAKYTWCGEIPESDAQKCYFLDEDGYIFDEAPYFSGEVYFKFYGLSDGLGSYFSKQYFKQLISFKDVLISLGLKPVALNITNNGDVEIFLSRGASSISTTGPKIIFKIDADFKNVIENLQAALNTEPLKSKFKNKYSSLQYIDLRFGNKVYDKFQ